MTEEAPTYEPEPLTITDSAGEVRTQRKIDINEPVKKKKRAGRPPKMVRVYNKINAKLFLNDGRTLAPLSEGEVSKADLAIQSIADRVVVIG